MKKHDEYVKDKTMLSYEKYLRGEAFQKARAIILDDGKVVLIRDIGKNVVTIPGGGVDENETILEAAKREAKEELGYDVEPLMIVDSDCYNVPLSIGSIDFESRREAYFVLCELKKKGSANGLEGEYEKGVEVFLADIDALKQLHVSESGIEAIRAYAENQKS